MRNYLAALLCFTIMTMNAKTIKNDEPEFIAVHHASFIIRAAGMNIFVDPVGDINEYQKYGSPDVILVTHEHGDHLDIPLLQALKTEKTHVVLTSTVFEKTGFGTVMKNNTQLKIGALNIEAIPAYNLTAERTKYHPKGRGNGYVLTVAGKRIYISGDTEDIPDMRKLKNIDYAFVCMNLPYTMSVDQAAAGILAFKPKNVFPYHYRNQDETYSDVHGRFKELLKNDPEIKIHYLNWY